MRSGMSSAASFAVVNVDFRIADHTFRHISPSTLVLLLSGFQYPELVLNLSAMSRADIFLNRWTGYIWQLRFKPCFEPTSNGFGRLTCKERLVYKLSQPRVADNPSILKASRLAATGSFRMSPSATYSSLTLFRFSSLLMVVLSWYQSTPHSSNYPFRTQGYAEEIRKNFLVDHFLASARPVRPTPAQEILSRFVNPWRDLCTPE